MINFNKPYLTGNEIPYIKDAVERGVISGNGFYTKRCHTFFEDRFGFKKVLLTTSCTDALEMAAILCEVEPGDEVIMPAYTFVSTANAFVLRGATIVFCDSLESEPCMDVGKLEALITPKTKAIVPVHYAGVACDMDRLMDIATKHNLFVVEDAAQAIDSFYNGRPLGGIGHIGAFSFHETKNIISGEGGMIVLNDERFIKRAEVIWEKGTNRASFWRGEVDKYGWVDIGSSFLPSEITAAFLLAQLESLDSIQNRRKLIWKNYLNFLHPLSDRIGLPFIPDYASNNSHMFYIICNDLEDRTALSLYLKSSGINAVFHYLGLHKSAFYKDKYTGEQLSNVDRFENCLLRLPFYYELEEGEQQFISNAIINYYTNGV